MNTIATITNNQRIVKRNKSNSSDLIKAGFDSLATSTQRAYESDLKQFLNIVNVELTAVTVGDVVRYVAELNQRGYRSTTINRRIHSLSKIFSLYSLAGIVDSNPVETLKKMKRITRTIPKSVTTQINIDDVRHVIAVKNRTSLIVEVLAETGLRISELLQIKKTDVEAHSVNDQKFVKIRILGKGKKERTVFLALGLFERVTQVFNNDSEFLFSSQSGRQLNRNNVYKQIRNLFSMVTGLDVGPHQLRHLFATYKISVERYDAKAVSLYLGHSTTSITLDMYVNSALTADQTSVLHN